jgi:hypothetical protein
MKILDGEDNAARRKDSDQSYGNSANRFGSHDIRSPA